MSVRRLAIALSLLAPAASLAGAAPAAAELPAPVAAGTSAANVDLSATGRRVLVRWVARSSGTLAALHLRIQADGATCRLSGKTGYGAGDGGSWHVTTHPVLADGRPDQSTTLATQDFRPCTASTDVVDVRQGIVRLAMGLRVTSGQEYATVISNADPSPAQNYTSPNFLYTASGLVGANARNERSPLASDSFYGLDPRELVGYSADGGRTWSLPGGPYGNPGGRNFLPTYLQEYSDGQIAGQPYYYSSTGSTTDRTMVFQNIRHSWTIRELGAFTSRQGSGTLRLTIDGREVASAAVSGSGMLRAPIAPVTVSPGQVVRVTASGLTILNVVADTAWGRLMGLHLSSKPWYVEGEPNFSQAAPVYALPAYGTPEQAPPVEQPPAQQPPAETPPGQTPPAEQPPAPAPPAATPPAEQPPVLTPPVQDPPVQTPPAQTPPAQDPPAQPPVGAVEPPVLTPPVLTPPVVDPPVVKPPAVKPPVAKPPVPKPPAVKPPAVKPPRPTSGSGKGCRRRAKRHTPPRKGRHPKRRRRATCRASGTLHSVTAGAR